MSTLITLQTLTTYLQSSYLYILFLLLYCYSSIIWYHKGKFFVFSSILINLLACILLDSIIPVFIWLTGLDYYIYRYCLNIVLGSRWPALVTELKYRPIHYLFYRISDYSHPTLIQCNFILIISLIITLLWLIVRMRYLILGSF